MPFSVSSQPLLSAQVPCQEATIAAHRNCVLVVREELQVVHSPNMLLQMRDHFLTLHLPHAQLSLRTTRDNEADVGSDLHRGHAALVGIVDVPQVLALLVIESHQPPIAASSDEDVLRACDRRRVSARLCRASQLGAVIVGVPERHQAVRTTRQEVVRDAHRVGDIIHGPTRKLIVQLNRQVLATDPEGTAAGGHCHDLAAVGAEGHRRERAIQADLPLLSHVHRRGPRSDGGRPIASTHHQASLVAGNADHAEHAAGADGHEALERPILHQNDGHITCGGPSGQILLIRQERHAREIACRLARTAHKVGHQLALRGVEVPHRDAFPPTGRCQVLVSLSPLDVPDKATANHAQRGLGAELAVCDDQAAGGVVYEDALVDNVATTEKQPVIVREAQCVDAVVLLLETRHLLLDLKIPQDDVCVLALLTCRAEAPIVRYSHAGDEVVMAL
mmetsp:Transcript_91438/g.238249  ORF Transcript_91438/g.238249 Transcript_91438/m.238249 type:complete len:448 (-) Transcript_91438:218-1561(-)